MRADSQVAALESEERTFWILLVRLAMRAIVKTEIN
jgi:hypothetical protein